MDIKSILLAAVVLFFLFLGPVYSLAIKPPLKVSVTDPSAYFDGLALCALAGGNADSMRALGGEVIAIEGEVMDRTAKKGFLTVWVQGGPCGDIQLDMDPAFAGADSEFAQVGNHVSVKGRVVTTMIGSLKTPSHKGQSTAILLEKARGI